MSPRSIHEAKKPTGSGQKHLDTMPMRSTDWWTVAVPQRALALPCRQDQHDDRQDQRQGPGSRVACASSFPSCIPTRLPDRTDQALAISAWTCGDHHQAADAAQAIAGTALFSYHTRLAALVRTLDEDRAEAARNPRIPSGPPRRRSRTWAPSACCWTRRPPRAPAPGQAGSGARVRVRPGRGGPSPPPTCGPSARAATTPAISGAAACRSRRRREERDHDRAGSPSPTPPPAPPPRVMRVAAAQMWLPTRRSPLAARSCSQDGHIPHSWPLRGLSLQGYPAVPWAGPAGIAWMKAASSEPLPVKTVPPSPLMAMEAT